MNILQALDDPAIFKQHFRGVSWTFWRMFLTALFAFPMDVETLALFQHHTGRLLAPTTAFTQAALIVGRRGGKSLVLALIGVFLGCFRDYRPYLAPGEFGTVAIIAADRRQARAIMRYVMGLLRAVPMLAELIESDTAESVTLKNGVIIEIHAASFRSTRGYTMIAVLCDEIAFWRSEESANPDIEILAALRPGLASIPGAMLLLASSPYRKRGVLYAAFAKHWGQDDARVLVVKATTAEANPKIDRALIATAYEDDPESAASEYGAEWRNDLSDFIPRDVINACTAMGRYEIGPSRGRRYVAFIDPSGGTGSDSMTLAIAHQDGEKSILDAVREVRPPFSPETVTIDFAAVLSSYGVTRVTGDRYAGEWPRERLRVHGIHYDLSDQPKSDIYRDCLPLLNSGRVQLLNLPRLASQFCGLERRTSRSGRDSIDHAPGAHDDIANVVAGALLMANAQSQLQPARMVRLNIMAR